MAFFNEYYSTLDRGYYHTAPYQNPNPVEFPEPHEQITNLTGYDIGSSEADIGQGNPMQHLQAAIRAGSAKMEFTFFGSSKSGSGQHTPESVGRLEREQMKELATLNNVKFSTHATVGIHGLAGMTKEGFEEQARHQSLREINKAIEFAAEAGTGGAVVFHTGEWQRPLTDIKGGRFQGYPDEDKTSPVMVVDNKTGDIVGIKRDQSVFEPKFMTAADYEKETGKRVIGKKDTEGITVEQGDWVDIDGNAIKHEWVLDEKRAEKLFDRVPIWNSKKTNFEVEEKRYGDFVNEAQAFKEKGINITPEELFVKTQYANRVLTAKGASLYHAQRYEEYKRQRDKIQEALDFVSKLEKGLPEDERWKLIEEISGRYGPSITAHKYSSREYKMPSEILKEELKHVTDEMRHVHEASASADAQAKDALDKMNNLTTLDRYGTRKSAETIAEAGINAMMQTQKHKNDLRDPLFVSPEPWLPQMYGSHPDEMRNIIVNSRKEMSRMLQTKGYSKQEAEDMAKTHIKGTLDTGHFNTWRKYWQAAPNESPQEAEKKFEKWYLDETEKLAKEGIIGHIHMTDNFGYDDEHLTPGQGNIPFKEFMKRMEKAGIKDFIVERGSDNPMALQDTLSEFGSPVYSLGRRFNMSNLRNAHFGYAAPANYIVGAYAPSNEWRLWSEVPLE